MKLSAFSGLLQAHPDKAFRLMLPDRSTVPVAFHITEVAHVQKRFIDCGGKRHQVDTCQLQAWLGDDTDHRLSAGKMAKVMEVARTVLPEGQDLDIEIEYEDATISQYPVASFRVEADAVVLDLTHKHTDCLARESCCPPQPRFQTLPLSAAVAVETAANCCATSGCC